MGFLGGRYGWSGSGNQLILGCLIGTYVFVDAGRGAAEDGLPPVRQLITETLTLCNADREENRSALNDVATAQCYLGEFAAARENLLPYTPEDFFQQAIHQRCARIEFAITGSTTSIPKALWNDGFGFMHCDAALAFIERGEIDQALYHIGEMPRSVHSGFNVFGVKVVRKLKERKENEGCRKVLLHWASCYERSETISHYRDSHRVPQLVAWLAEYQEKPVAAALCERWRAVLQAETDVDEYGEIIGRAWAEYALAIHALGETGEAKRALNESNRWIDRARISKTGFDQDFTNSDFASAYAAIAARRAVVFGAEEAAATYEQAFSLARLAVTPKFGEYVYEEIVDEQLTAGDTTGARETIKRVSQPRSIAGCWEKICKHELQNGNTESARLAARSAVEVLDRDGFEPFMAQDMAPVAAEAAIAGEKELAQKLFQRALGLSEVNETPKFNHPWIAGIQVHAGLYADAYKTIQLVEEPSDRTLPLSRLCKALAKAEYEGKRDGRGKDQ
jgi:tetratricopeptide (TPR) repeat protein